MTGDRAPSTSWLAVAAIALAGIVAAFQIGKLPAALPALRAELGLGLVEAGWIVSALAAVGVATGMVWGFVADRFGHRRMLLSGLGVVVLGTVLGSFADTGTELFLTRVIEGCGYVTVLTAGPTVIGAFCRERDRDARLGLTVTRKIGGAVVRNRARRRLRAAAAAIFPSCARAGYDYVLIARRTTPTRPYRELVGDMEKALARLHRRRRPRPDA